MKPTAAWLSVTGSVFGMAHTAEKPPAAAAIAPVATVSRSSCPGSRRCTWRSISPGATTFAAASTTSASSGRPRSRPERLHLAVGDEEVGDLVGAAGRDRSPARRGSGSAARYSPPPPGWAQSGEPPASR